MFRPAFAINWYKTSLILVLWLDRAKGIRVNMGSIREPRKIPNRLSSTATIIIDESRWCSWIPQWTAWVAAPAYFATPYFSVWKDFATTHFWVFIL